MGKASQLSSQNKPEENNSKGLYQSYEIDNDDNNLPFSKEIWSFPMRANFVPHKISKYEGKHDKKKKLLNKHMTQMSLRETSPAL